MKRLTALVICLITLVPSRAQDAPTVITPENAAALTLLESAGSELPVSVSFSPDSRYILAVTTDRTLVYSAEAPDAEPQIFPFNTFSFDAEGYLVGGGQRWNLDTGQSIGIPPSLTVVRDAVGDPAVIEVVKPGGEILRVETGIADYVAHLAVNDDYSALAVATVGDFQSNIYPTVYLFRLPTGKQIAALPQISSQYISNVFFTTQDKSSLLVVEAMETHIGFDGIITIYQAETGGLLPEFSGSIRQPLIRSEDGAFAYLLPDNTVVLGTGYAVTAFTHENTNSNTRIYIGRGGLAVVGGKIYLAPFDKDGNIGEFLVDNLYAYVSGTPAFSGSLFYYANDTNIYIWDAAASPAEEIRTIQTTARYRDTRISPDASLFSHIDEQGIMRIREAESDKLGRTRGRAPAHAVIAPDWSHVAFWQGQSVVILDLRTRIESPVAPGYVGEIEVISDHLGEIADFENGYVAFISEALQVVDVDSSDGHSDTVIIEGSFDGAQFFNDGACIVTFEDDEGWGTLVTIHALNPAAACQEAAYTMSASIPWAFVTPQGRYLYSTHCGFNYTPAEILRVYPLNGHPADSLMSPIYLDSCGEYGIAFNRGETKAYIVDPSYGIQMAASPAPDELIAWDDLVSVLAYYDPENNFHAYTTSVFLSPDEENVAIYITEYEPSLGIDKAYIEVFALDDLGPEVERPDVRPLLVIPDATVATFSPDGRYVVTDKGLYSVEFANATPAINGTISAFSPDSQTLATYQDGFVTLWDVSQPDTANTPLAQYDIRGVRELAFSEDGTRLYVIRDGEVQVWGIANLNS